MPRYRAKNRLFVGREIEPGEEFESDLPPGRNWEPLDEAAEVAAGARDETRGALYEQAARVDPHPTHPHAVDIPADWSGRSAQYRLGLAFKLGASKSIKLDVADNVIKTELARRGRDVAA